jgi:hypothetical protein
MFYIVYNAKKGGGTSLNCLFSPGFGGGGQALYEVWKPFCLVKLLKSLLASKVLQPFGLRYVHVFRQ